MAAVGQHPDRDALWLVFERLGVDVPGAVVLCRARIESGATVMAVRGQQRSLWIERGRGMHGVR